MKQRTVKRLEKYQKRKKKYWEESKRNLRREYDKEVRRK